MSDAAEPAWPDDAVEVASIVGAWGVKGWLRVQPYAADPQALLSARRWFLKPPDAAAGTAVRAIPMLLRIAQAKHYGDGIVAQAHDVCDRTQAQTLRGARIFVSRGSFPTPQPDEYYWVDLIGLDVVNRQDQTLGTVSGLIDTGGHSVLRVARPDAAPGDEAGERLIPFVAAYVDEVKFTEKRIVVDWGLDY